MTADADDGLFDSKLESLLMVLVQLDKTIHLRGELSVTVTKVFSKW